LPFHLLVTDKPVIAMPRMQINDMAAYRDAAWLVKRHAVTVLPSVASLKALRVFARKGQGTKPMIGFGDPVFARDQTAAAAGQRTELNADWVVLSACNTAAGEKPGAEALSGLARAFFYAGARALLLSHWRIDSKAATRLATSTFDIMKSTRPSAARRRYAGQCSPISTTGPIFGMPIRHSGGHSHWSGKVRPPGHESFNPTHVSRGIEYQPLRGRGTPRQRPFPMREDLLPRCNSATQDQYA